MTTKIWICLRRCRGSFLHGLLGCVGSHCLYVELSYDRQEFFVRRLDYGRRNPLPGKVGSVVLGWSMSGRSGVRTFRYPRQVPTPDGSNPEGQDNVTRDTLVRCEYVSRSWNRESYTIRSFVTNEERPPLHWTLLVQR